MKYLSTCLSLIFGLLIPFNFVMAGGNIILAISVESKGHKYDYYPNNISKPKTLPCLVDIVDTIDRINWVQIDKEHSDYRAEKHKDSIYSLFGDFIPAKNLSQHMLARSFGIINDMSGYDEEFRDGPRFSAFYNIENPDQVDATAKLIKLEAKIQIVASGLSWDEFDDVDVVWSKETDEHNLACDQLVEVLAKQLLTGIHNETSALSKEIDRRETKRKLDESLQN